MKTNQYNFIFAWAKSIIILLGLGFLYRIIFILYNFSSFTYSSFSNLLKLFLTGFYFDFIGFFYALIPFTLLSLFPLLKNKSSILHYIKLFYFLGICLVFTILMGIDLSFFPISKTRIGVELLEQTGTSNISVWIYIKDYWGLAIIIIFTIMILRHFYLKIQDYPYHRIKLKTFPIIISILFISFFIIRGGTRLKPIRASDVSLFVEPELAIFGSNTLFNMYESSQSESIQIPNYLNENDFTNFQNQNYKSYKDETPFNKKNIVIIILESFGEEYCFPKTKNTKSYTPFLNELSKKCIIFNQSFANGLKSVDAIPSILCGIPKLTKTNFLYTQYALNKTSDFASILRPEGYECIFYHGGKNGTMGFESFLKQKHWQYSGLNEYPNKNRDYDQHWGIADAPYLQFMSQSLNDIKNPFLASVFTLSSHHPFTIPDFFKDSVLHIKEPIHQSVRYTDHALRMFFESAQKTEWYKNSIFVITADHSSQNFESFYLTPIGKYRVPLLIFDPQKQNQRQIEKIIQHIDIMPTVLQYLSYDKTCFSFGTSGLDSTEKGIAFQYNDDRFQFYDGDLHGFTNQNTIFKYNLFSDPLCKHNLSNTIHPKDLIYFKSLIQNHHYRIKKNKWY